MDQQQLLTVIHRPIITDKTTKILEKNQYCFQISPKTTKIQIKQAIEFIFNVKVIKVNTYYKPRKKRKVGRFQGYRKHYKKAIVTLFQNDKINLFSSQ